MDPASVVGPGSGADEWVAELRRLGIRVLRNERVEIGDRGASIDLAGVDDWSATRGANGLHLERALTGRDPDRSLVLLAHQPRGVAEAVRAGVELQLSGHTHGGQLHLGALTDKMFAVARQPYLRGHFHLRGNQLYVNRGLGFGKGTRLPRVNSDPELTVFTLRAVA